jgi:glycosyltransferase involved in cell wall biosynthesis
MTISVLMPAFNEGEHIAENLLVTQSVLESLPNSWEIILINDGSQDNTYSEAFRISRKCPEIKVIDIPENQGKGHALKRGFQEVRGDVVVFLDADLELPPHQLENFLRPLEAGKAEVIIGSKSHPLSQGYYPKRRKVISWIYAKILWMLFQLPIRDTQSGFKVYKREVLDRIFPRILCKRFAYDIEILINAHRLGYTILEIPVSVDYSRPKQWGRIGLKTLLFTGLDTLGIFFRMNFLKYYDRE